MTEKEVMKVTALKSDEAAEMTAERVAEIAKEFSAGFEFLRAYPRSVTFFGSAQSKEGDPNYDAARELSRRIVTELGYAVVSGGGPGIMEAADRGAFEAGGNSLGLLIKLPNVQPTNGYIKKSISFHYFFARKVCLAFGAEVFIFFPGGYGTLDEFFEIVTLMQTKKIAPAPIVCVGKKYWQKLQSFISEMMLARGMVEPGDLQLFTITDNLDEVVEVVRKAAVQEKIPFTLSE